MNIHLRCNALFLSAIACACLKVALLRARAALPRQASASICLIFSESFRVISFINGFTGRALLVRIGVVWVLVLAFVVQSIVLCCGHYLQILKTIIFAVFVDVMDIFITSEPPSKMLFHYPAVLMNTSPINKQFNVTFPGPSFSCHIQSDVA